MLALKPMLSIESAGFGAAQRLRDTVNAAYSLSECRLSINHTEGSYSMRATKPRVHDRNESTLPFDTTQEIDPALVADLRPKAEATLTQADFDDITVVLPPKPAR